MNPRSVLGPALGILFLLIFLLIVGTGVAAWPAGGPAVINAGEALWKGRTFEVILQGFMILSGVMSILLLLGTGRLRGGLS
jgi:hypothetical protein